jgi:small subunit ribosomal protein S9
MAQAKGKATPTPKQAPVGHGVGRRKSAIARVWVRRGKGAIQVNKLDVNDYFDTHLDTANAQTPMRLLPFSANYDIQATVRGGGKTAQADAVKLAIARSFVAMDESIRPLLREHRLLTVDDRVKERKKYGRKAARRRFQFVKR